MAKPRREMSYGDLCREFVARICHERRITKVQLANELGLHSQALSSLGYRGMLSLEKVVEIARMANASLDELGQLERAWMLKSAKKDARGPVARVMQMLEKYREEVARLQRYLQKHGLWDDYKKRRKWNPDHGLMSEDPPPPPPRRAAKRRPAR